MDPLEDYANEFFTPEILSLVFLLTYMSTKLYEGWFGNFISLKRREIRRRINRRRRRRREPTTAPAQLRQRVPYWQRVPYRKSHSAPTKEVTTPSSRSRIFRIAIILVTIQSLPEIFTGLGLSDEISEIISYGILNNLSPNSWLQAGFILSVGYLIVESTFERKNFHLFAILIVFCGLFRPLSPENALFFPYCFLLMSILQAMKVENSNVRILGFSADIRDYIGPNKVATNTLAVGLLSENSRWSFLHDDPKDRSAGILYFMLAFSLVVIDITFLDGSLDTSTIGVVIYAVLILLALTCPGIILALLIIASLYPHEPGFQEVTDFLIALGGIYILFYPMRYYFNNRKIMQITNLIGGKMFAATLFGPLKEELRSSGWMRKIFLWIMLGICGFLNNLIVSLICVIQLLFGLLVLIINAIYLFITGWLRSFGFSVPVIDEGHDVITIDEMKQHLAWLSLVIVGIVLSIFHGILAPWISAYEWFAGVPADPPEGSSILWHMFRNSESADYPLIYYLVAAVSWYHSIKYMFYIFCFLVILLLVGAAAG